MLVLPIRLDEDPAAFPPDDNVEVDKETLGRKVAGRVVGRSCPTLQTVVYRTRVLVTTKSDASSVGQFISGRAQAQRVMISVVYTVEVTSCVWVAFLIGYGWRVRVVFVRERGKVSDGVGVGVIEGLSIFVPGRGETVVVDVELRGKYGMTVLVDTTSVGVEVDVKLSGKYCTAVP